MKNMEKEKGHKMDFLTQFNGFIEKWMALVTPACLIMGILCADWLSHFSFLVTGLFAFMTFTGSLGSNFKDMGRIAKHPIPLVTVLILLHVVMPLIAFGVGRALFGQDMDLVTGIVLEFLVPTGIVSLAWVNIYGGHSALTISIIVIDTLLAPFMVPLMLHGLLGSVVEMAPWGMMQQLVLMIALPALAAMALNQWTMGRVSQSWKPRLAPFSKLALIGVVTINSTRIAPYMTSLTPTLIAVAGCILGLAIFGYIAALGMSRVLHLDGPDTISVMYNGGMRNISAGAVIAAQYFPSEVLFPVMIGTLFQQVIAAGAGMMIVRMPWFSRGIPSSH